jgi:hypothetical protein
MIEQTSTELTKAADIRFDSNENENPWQSFKNIYFLILPDPDPLVRGMDPVPSINKQK